MGDGLSSNVIHSIEQDARSNILLGTDGFGISSFNGRQFKGAELPDEFQDAIIYTIEKLPDGGALVGSTKGLLLFDYRGFQPILMDHEIYCILEKGPNLYYAGTSKGLLTVNLEKAEETPYKSILTEEKITSLCQYDQGLLIGTQTGLYYSNLKNAVPIYPDMFDRQTEIVKLIRESSDLVWIATKTKGIFRLYNKLVQALDFRYEGSVNAMVKYSDDALAIATGGDGVFIYDPIHGTTDQILERNGLANDVVLSLKSDKWNNLWAGTEANGISKISLEAVQQMGRGYGLPENSVNVVETANDGSLWFSHSSTKLGKFEGTNFINYDASLDFPPVRITKLFEDKFGRLWVGTRDNGIILKDSTGFKSINLPDFSSWITDIETDRTGSIWISSVDNGILNLDFGTSGFPNYQIFSSEEGLDKYIIDIERDPESGIWMISDDHNLFHLTDSKVLSKANPSLDDDELKVEEIFSDGRRVWFRSTTDQIGHISIKDSMSLTHMINGRAFRNQPTRKLLIVDDVLCLFHLDGMDKYEIRDPFNPRYMETVSFPRTFNRPFTNASSLAVQDNIIWCGSSSGLLSIDLKGKKESIESSMPYLTKVSILYEDLLDSKYAENIGIAYSLQDPLVLPPNENDIGFEFDVASFGDFGEKMFQWKLEGHDDHWSPISTSRSVNYSNLDYGHYTFYVRSIDGTEMDESRLFTFEIKQSIYKTFWFKGLLALLLLTGLYLLFKIRTAGVRRTALRQQKDLETQLTQLNLEQKALQLQMNPHFIFNAMNSVQGLIVKKDFKLARKQLNDLSRLMRSMLQFSRENSISLDDEMELLKSYLEIERIGRGERFNYTIHEPTFDASEVSIPPMMIQVFVENAIIHGVNHQDVKGQIDLSFEEIGNKILCIIEDNGIGREAAGKLVNKSHKSTASSVIIDRLRLLHRNSRLDVLKIIDKFDDNGNAAGTRVELLLPTLN